MTQKVQCWDVTFLPITQGWTDSINPWTKLVCYWHILTQNYQAWVFSQTVFIAHTHAHTLSHSRIVRFVGWARCEDKMLNILAAGELHYWNVLRQHIQDDDGGGSEKTAHTLWLYSCRGSSKRAENRRPHSPISHAARPPTRWLVKHKWQFPPCIFKCLQLQKSSGAQS